MIGRSRQNCSSPRPRGGVRHICRAHWSWSCAQLACPRLASQAQRHCGHRGQHQRRAQQQYAARHPPRRGVGCQGSASAASPSNRRQHQRKHRTDGCGAEAASSRAGAGVLPAHPPAHPLPHPPTHPLPHPLNPLPPTPALTHSPPARCRLAARARPHAAQSARMRVVCECVSVDSVYRMHADGPAPVQGPDPCIKYRRQAGVRRVSCRTPCRRRLA